MDIKLYRVIATPTAHREIIRIYDYILNDLKAEQAAERILNLIESEIEILGYMPKMYMKIEKFDEAKSQYRRTIIKNYVLLYTIDEDNNIVYISNIYYSKRNYLK